jgi:hypothetical protein
MRRLVVKVIAVLLSLCLVAVPVLAEEGEASLTEYDRGYADGEIDGGGHGVWILSGLFLGPIGLILPWIFTPEVPAGALVGKSPQYVEGYQDGYRSSTKKGNFMYSLIGLGIVVVVGIGVMGTGYLIARAAEGAAESCSEAIDNSCGVIADACSWDPNCVFDPTCAAPSCNADPTCGSSGCESSGCETSSPTCTSPTCAALP